MPPQPIRVLVVDDHPDITDILSYVIGVDPQLECVGRLHSADRLAEEIRALRPDVMILDARMPGVDPLTALVGITPEFPGLRTIFYSGYDDPEFIEQIIDAGAWGFVSKGHASDAVVRAIHAVAAGKVVFPERRRRTGLAGTEPPAAAKAPPAAAGADGP